MILIRAKILILFLDARWLDLRIRSKCCYHRAVIKGVGVGKTLMNNFDKCPRLWVCALGSFLYEDSPEKCRRLEYYYRS